MEQTPSRHESKKKKNNKFLRLLPWVGSTLLIVVLAIGAYLYTTKQPVTVLVPGGTSVVTTVIVCDDSVVGAYNVASKLEIRGSNTDLSADAVGLNNLDSQIRSKSGFDQDPTCQTILFWNAIANNDEAKASTALTAIESLHDSHHFADTNLEGNATIPAMKDSLSATVADKR